jgi:phosphotransferase system HPr (HPr) family protein
MPSSSEEHAEGTAVLPPGIALHARPAAAFVRAATRFDSSIAVAANGRKANAKSILEVLALGATEGTELLLRASGMDATRAVRALVAIVDTLG